MVSNSLRPLTKLFGPLEPRVAQLLVELTQRQAALLVQGVVNGQPCPDIRKLTGIAYLSGMDTWVDGNLT
jgi:hypothetical protein